MLTVITALLVAPPPLGGFPAVVFPSDGGDAPPNFSVFATGDPAPSPDLVGLVLEYDGVAQPEVPFEPLGCCALIATPSVAPVDGTQVRATLTTSEDELVVSFAISGLNDTTAPTFAVAPQVLDAAPSPDGTALELIIAADPTDDRLATLFTALQTPEHGGALVGSSADGFTLKARLPGQPTGEVCVDVTAYDVAENPSSPLARACTTIAEGEGEGAEGEGDGEGEGEPNGCGCRTASPSIALVALAALLRHRSHRRIKER
jgi:MYXO-CTERM domain-containing protein